MPLDSGATAQDLANNPDYRSRKLSRALPGNYLNVLVQVLAVLVLICLVKHGRQTIDTLLSSHWHILRASDSTLRTHPPLHPWRIVATLAARVEQLLSSPLFPV